jgi:hypothetical protein
VHGYSARAAKLQAQVRPGQVVYVYSARVPQYVAPIAYTAEPLRARIGATPDRDTHTRLGTSQAVDEHTRIGATPDRDANTRLGTTPVIDENERIGPEIGTATPKRIGDPAK